MILTLNKRELEILHAVMLYFRDSRFLDADEREAIVASGDGEFRDGELWIQLADDEWIKAPDGVELIQVGRQIRRIRSGETP